MEDVAYKKVLSSAFGEYGYIVGKINETFTVQTKSAIFEALCATSCLLEPEVGDKVLICYAEGDEAYILAVLEKGTKNYYTMALPGNITISSTNGSINMKAREKISMISNQSIELSSFGLSGYFESANLVVNKLLYIGQVMQATLSRIKTVANVVESIADRFHQLLKNSYRTVEEAEHTKTGSLHCVVDKLLSLRGKYTVITAKTDVKINGKHIHMG